MKEKRVCIEVKAEEGQILESRSLYNEIIKSSDEPISMSFGGGYIKYYFLILI